MKIAIDEVILRMIHTETVVYNIEIAKNKRTAFENWQWRK